MGRSRLPLVALLGAVGCTKQDAAEPHDATAAEDAPPWRVKGARPGDESAKGSSIRALTPEERANLVAAPAAPAPIESSDAGTPPDYAEQRQQSYEKRMQQLQEDAQLRQEGSGLMGQEAATDHELLDGPAPQDLAGQRRLQLAKDRRQAERIRKEGYRKGSGITGIKRKDFIQIIRDTDGGTPAPVKKN